MQIVAFIVGIVLIFFVLLDAFETVVLPRQVGDLFRFTVLFSRTFWVLWTAPARFIQNSRRKENYLSFFGPLNLLLLLVLWQIGLILGFSVVFWALSTPIHSPDKIPAVWTDLFTSAASLFSVGFGDVTPGTLISRLLMIFEGGIGLAFLALVIGYLPAVYQSFSQREKDISMIDARAGSPPTAYEMLRRCAQADRCAEAQVFLSNWEVWSAEFLETHLSYPVLGFYRSQHENQSWLAALTVILDTSALLSIVTDGAARRQAGLTFAMARHAIVDLTQVFQTPPDFQTKTRLSNEDFELICSGLEKNGMYLQAGEDGYERMSLLCKLYEPYLLALSKYFLMPLPGWLPVSDVIDNWQTTAWGGPGQVRL